MPQSRGFAYWNALAEHELPKFGSADHGYFFRATWKALRQARALDAAGDAVGARKVLNDRVWAIEQRELPKLAGQPGEEAARVRAYLTEAAALYHAGRLPGARADAGGALALPVAAPLLPGGAPSAGEPLPLGLPERRQAPRAALPELVFAAEPPPDDWRARGLHKYARLLPHFAVTDEARATRYRGEVLRDLEGNPVAARPGTDAATQREFFHTASALAGREVQPGTPPRTRSNRAGGILDEERAPIPVARWNATLTNGRLRVTAADPRLHPAALARLEEAVQTFTADGYTVTIASANRDYATQRRLYQLYIAGKGAPAANPDGNPPHMSGGAVDIRISKDGVSSTGANEYA